MTTRLTIDATHVHGLWQQLAVAIIGQGQHSAPRGKGVTELLGVSLHLSEPLNNVLWHPNRKLSYRFMVAEWLWIYFGHDDVKTIARYNPNIVKFSDNGVNFNGSYGVPVQAQWRRLVELLQRDPDTRQAVLVIFRPQSTPSKDVPCTISLQFLLRQGRLHTVATMRSSDLWLGLPYDVFNFTMLANCLATEIGCPPLGGLTLQLGSSHIYDENLDSVEDLMAQSRHFDSFRSPRLKAPPPAFVDAWLQDPFDPAAYVSATNLWVQYREVLNGARNSSIVKTHHLMEQLGTKVWDE